MMIKNYNNFLNNFKLIIENKISRENIKNGSRVITMGQYDGVDLDYKIGTVLSVKDYGLLLIEFDESFSPKLHGAEGRGKNKHCFFINLDNILSLNENRFEQIINDIRIKLNTDWRTGDVFIGDGISDGINIDGELGIIYYPILGKTNIYWAGFLKNIDKKLRCDQTGYPYNNFGANVNKIHIRQLNEKESIDLKKEIDELQKLLILYITDYKPMDIVVCNGTCDYLEFKDQIGIIIKEVQRNRYIVYFLEKFNNNLYDIDGVVGDDCGYYVQKKIMRYATIDEIELNKSKIEKAIRNIQLTNYNYQVGDYVICKYEDLKGKHGIIIAKKNNDQYIIEFFEHHSEYLRKLENSKTNNCIKLSRQYFKLIDPEIYNKIRSGELLPILMSSKMILLMNRMNININNFLTISYFDVTNKNDTITYISSDKFKRLEKEEDPYKSRFRQQTKIGKLIKMIDSSLSEKDIEKLVNEFKSNYDLYISGVSDRLKLVSGEDIRFWYNGRNYVKGGGSLNNSCMMGDDKGPEMQMFVDNPDTIQMLILLDVDYKLLGRSLIWKLSKPEGKTFMDSVYTRYDNDRELFYTYGREHGWLSYGGKMECKLNTNKKYVMGKNALDHFDTFYRIVDGNTLVT